MSEEDLTRWAQQASAMAIDESPSERAQFIAATVGRQAARMGMAKDDVASWLQSAYGRVWVSMSRSRLDPGLDLKEVRQEIFKAMGVERNPVPPPPAGRGHDRLHWFEKTFPVGTPIIFRGTRNIQIGKWTIPDGVKGEVVEIHPYELQIRLFPPVPGDPRFRVIEEQLSQPENKGTRVEDLDVYVSIDGAVSGYIEPLIDTWGGPSTPTHTPRYRMPPGRRARLKPNSVFRKWSVTLRARDSGIPEEHPVSGWKFPALRRTVVVDAMNAEEAKRAATFELQRTNPSLYIVAFEDVSLHYKDRVQPNRARPLKGAAMATKFGDAVDDIDDIGGKDGRDLDAAMDRYETFHKKAPIRVAELDHDLPKSWVPVGDALAVMYRTDKWKKDGTDIDYKHLHDKGDDKPYDLGKGVRFYEPASEANKSQVQGRRTSRPNKKRPQRLSTGNPEALTLLGYCLGVFVRRDDDNDQVYEINPRACYLFSSPSGNMLAMYSPTEGFLGAMAGGNLRVLKDGIDG